MWNKHSLKNHLHLNDARCFIAIHVLWRSKHHYTWQNAFTVLSGSVAYRASGTIAVCRFSRLRYYRGHPLFAFLELSGWAANRTTERVGTQIEVAGLFTSIPILDSYFSIFTTLFFRLRSWFVNKKEDSSSISTPWSNIGVWSHKEVLISVIITTYGTIILYPVTYQVLCIWNQMTILKLSGRIMIAPS